MELKELRSEICNHLIQVTALKPSDVISIESDTSNVYIKTKNNKEVIILVTTEEVIDRSMDYEFEI